jgi:hypothetical protein
MDWRSVCRGIDDSCWTVCGGIDGSCWTVCAEIGGSRGGVLCAINCFGAPLVGARGFLGFRPLLFGMAALIFDFARTTTNLAAASAGSAAFFTITEWNTYDGFFASATTCKARSRSLAVAFRTQCFIWHCSPPKPLVLTAISAAATLAAEALQQIEQDLLRITDLIGKR